MVVGCEYVISCWHEYIASLKVTQDKMSAITEISAQNGNLLEKGIPVITSQNFIVIMIMWVTQRLILGINPLSFLSTIYKQSQEARDEKIMHDQIVTLSSAVCIYPGVDPADHWGRGQKERRGRTFFCCPPPHRFFFFFWIWVGKISPFPPPLWIRACTSNYVIQFRNARIWCYIFTLRVQIRPLSH